MTDTDTAVARLEAVLDRLERLGLVPPVPGQTAAVDPDGYPGAVVSGELIEAAWGNAVVTKLRNHGLTQAGADVVGPYSANIFRCVFARAFPTPPIVVAWNGDSTRGPHVVMALKTVATTYFDTEIVTLTNVPHGALTQINYVAIPDAGELEF